MNKHIVTTKQSSFPRAFLVWLIDEQEVFMGELSEKYIINDNPCSFKSLDDLFAHWQNINH